MVSGKVAANNEPFHNIQGFPTETEMSKSALELPKESHGKVLGDGYPEISIFRDPGNVVKVKIERGRFKFLKMIDTLSLLDSDDEPFAGGAYIKDEVNIIGKSRLVLYSHDDRPLCLAVQETFKINKAYYIYGTQPLIDGDKPQEKVADVDFYPWYRVRDIDDSHLDWRSLLIWNGNNYQPHLRINPQKRLPDEPLGNFIPPRKGDNRVCLPNDPNTVFALMHQKSDLKERRWDLCISPGADIMAMIMLGAIMDDMVGWFA